MVQWIPSSSLTMMWTPEQAAAFQAAYQTAYEQIWLPLQVPAWTVWQASLSACISDLSQAVISTSHFSFLTGRPIVLLLYRTVEWILRFLWKHVIVEGVSQRGVQYLTWAGQRTWQWQRSLTPRELAIEVAVVVTVVALYQIRKVLQRQAYFRRLAVWTRKQMNRVKRSYLSTRRAISKSYDRAVKRIAQTSLFAAVMTPHMVWIGAAVAAKVLMPEIVKWLACETAFVFLLRALYPIVATLYVLQDERLLEASKRNESNAENDLKTPKKKKKAARTPTFSSPMARFFPRTTPKKTKGQSPQDVALAEWKEREAYWKQFWMVSAAWQVFKCLVAILPGTSHALAKWPVSRNYLLELELVFYLWVYFLPYMIPTLEGAPEGRPLAMLAPRIGKLGTSIYKGLNVLSDEWWQAWVVRWAGMALSFGVFSRLLSQESADRYRHGIAHGQSFLIPVASLLMPRFVSVYGQLFVQYTVPVYQQHHTKAKHMLEYWILHCVLTEVVDRFASVLWWIPLSAAATFAAYLLLAVSPSFVRGCIYMILRDLEIFGLVVAVDQSQTLSVDQSWTAKGVQALLHRLPKAAAAADDDKDTTTTSRRDDDKKQDEELSNPPQQTKVAQPTTPPARDEPVAAAPQPQDDDDDDNLLVDEESDDAAVNDDGDEDYVEPDDALADVVSTSSSSKKKKKPNVKNNKENHRSNVPLRRSERNRKKKTTTTSS